MLQVWKTRKCALAALFRVLLAWTAFALMLSPNKALKLHHHQFQYGLSKRVKV